MNLLPPISTRGEADSLYSCFWDQRNINDYRYFYQYFGTKKFVLLIRAAAHCYDAVLDDAIRNPARYSRVLPGARRQNREQLRRELSNQAGDFQLHESIITRYLETHLQEDFQRTQLIFAHETRFKEEGFELTYVRDPFFKDANGTNYLVPVDKKSAFANGLDLPRSFKVSNDWMLLPHGNVWWGEGYVMLGAGEFRIDNKPPDLTRMLEVEQQILRNFIGRGTIKTIWAIPEAPVRFAGRDYYYPSPGHLDTMFCPLLSFGGKDIFITNDYDKLYYADSEVPFDVRVYNGLVKPLYEGIHRNVEKQFDAIGKRVEWIKLPVLRTNEGFYPYVNCIVDRSDSVIHFPAYRVKGDNYFNRAAMQCEDDIRKKIEPYYDVSFMDGLKFDFAGYVRRGIGGLHCLLNAKPKGFWS